MPYCEVLTQCPIFKNLSGEKIREILNDVTWQIRKFSKGEMVALAGEECRFLMIVVKGEVKGEMTDASGRVIKIEDIPAPRPLAFSFIFGNKNILPVNITTTADSIIMFIPRTELITILQLNRQVLENVLSVISSRAQFLSQKIRTLSLKDLKGRIAQVLLELTNEQGATVTLPTSQTEMADYLGVARPSLARALKEMSDEGLINYNKRVVTIPDIRKLKSVLGEH